MRSLTPAYWLVFASLRHCLDEMYTVFDDKFEDAVLAVLVNVPATISQTGRIKSRQQVLPSDTLAQTFRLCSSCRIFGFLENVGGK